MGRPTPPLPAVTAVVLHWGAPEATARCVRSLQRCGYANLSVIVVDNLGGPIWNGAEPADRTVVLRPGRNEGYAGGNNLALQQARAAGARYALLVNNDATVRADAVDVLVATAESDPRIAFAGARLVDPDDRGEPHGSHGSITYGPFLVAIAPDVPEDTARDVEWVSGCCLLVRLAALEEIGTLDEEFFLYCEDVDWCERARRLGYRVVYEPRAVALHRATRSLEVTCRRAYFLARNGLLFARKHATAAQRLRTVALALALPVASVARRLLYREPLLPAVWVARGVFDGLLRRPPRLESLGLRPTAVSR